jgi:hypothetical protein
MPGPLGDREALKQLLRINDELLQLRFNTRFQLQRFTVSMKELAEWFGLEVAQIVVDECLAQREN